MNKHYSMNDLLAIMAQLRSPEGCPWDREQNHHSILSCFIEETFEFIEAVEKDDLPNMAEELGDVLLQVIFHSQMAKEAGNFSFEDVVQGIAEKLVRRHPHVFGDSQAGDSSSVIVQWEKLKAEEKASRLPHSGQNPDEESLLGQIPRGLPSLPKAQKIQKRAAKVGFDWPDYQGPLAKVYEELEEFKVELDAYQALQTANPAPETSSLTATSNEMPSQESRAPIASRDMAGEHPTPEREKAKMEAEFGDLLFAMANLARHLDIDAERALSSANHRFIRRFEGMESLAKTSAQDFIRLGLAEKEALWQKVKALERGGK
jgi:MazG family protein